MQTTPRGQVGHGQKLFQMNTTKGINQLIEDFLNDTDCSPGTISNYRVTLKVWVTWMTRFGDVRNPSKSDILRYKKYLLSDVRFKTTTVDSYLASVRLFFKYLETKEISDNVTLGVKYANKNNYSRRGSLTPEMVNRLLCSMNRDTLTEKRNFAVVNMMVRLGLRCTEVKSIDVGDFAENSISLLRKGRIEKDAQIILPSLVSEPIEEYLSFRSDFDSDSPLFVDHRNEKLNKRLSYKTISRIVIAALRSSGIDSKDITAHSLRHTAAQSAVTGGSSVIDIQQLLGHKRIETTMRYLEGLKRENKQATNAIASIENVYKMAQNNAKTG